MDNFIVSARKYRPVTFESVVGQKHITDTLKNAISRGQLAHAYLFCGPRGVGKTTCARIFAKAINCLAPVASESCGVCESCRGFDEGRSFNIHELDAASNNSVDDIRSLTEQVRIPPQIGRYSVYIIDEVHMLSAAAFNAFLKTLEEPPAHAVFILATTEKHKIIPTILSRCQIFDFNRIRAEDAVGYLKYISAEEKVRYDDESLHLIARKADGGMRDALSMFDKAISFCGDDLNFKEVAKILNVLDYDVYFNVTSLILSGDYPAVLTLFDEVLRNGFSGQVFIAGLNSHFRDMLMCKNPQTIGLLEVTGTLLERYRKEAQECDADFLFEAIALMTALDGTLRTATNQRLNVELGLMKLCALGQKKNARPLADKPEGAETAQNITGDSNNLSLSGYVDLPPLNRKEMRQPQVKEKPLKVTAEESEKKTPEPVKKIEEDTSSDTGLEGETAPQATVTSEKVAESKVLSGHQDHPAIKSTSSTDAPLSAPKEYSDVPQKRNGNSSPMISGTSITSLLNNTGKYSQVAETDDNVASKNGQELSVDPESEDKITAAKDKFIRNLNTERPRIAMAFRQMKVAGHKVFLTVPSETLYEEIMRNRMEILTLLAEVADIEGTLALEVKVKEDTSGRKPIKVEDRLRFLTEQNPVLTLLRQKLDMDIE